MNGLARIACAAALCLLSVATVRAETLLERGRYLMSSIVACGNCHTPQTPAGPVAGRELAGGAVFDEPVFTAYASNITPDKETGIGGWTDAQIIRAIRDGIRPDGSLIGPPMPIPFYRGISDRDAQAIVAYLRSVPPVKNALPKSSYRIPLPTAYGPPVGPVAEIDPADRVAYGAYMAGPLGHCLECHTPMMGPQRDMEKAGAGGFPLSGPWGVTVSANITPDKATGLGAWTDSQIKAAITHGVRPSGEPLRPPMAFAYYKNIREDDLDSLVAYLRTMKPIENAVR